MSKYFAWFKQKGEGCDYTIGCGERLMELKGETYEQAFADFKARFIAETYFTLEEIERILILKIEVEFDISSEIERIKKHKAMVQRNRELAEYERLKKIYEA